MEGDETEQFPLLKRQVISNFMRLKEVAQKGDGVSIRDISEMRQFFLDPRSSKVLLSGIEDESALVVPVGTGDTSASGGSEGGGGYLPLVDLVTSSLSEDNPDDELYSNLWLKIALCLDAPDLYHLIAVNKTIHQALAGSKDKENSKMWKQLNDREKELSVSPYPGYERFNSRFTVAFLTVSNKLRFEMRSYLRNLPLVHWRQMSPPTSSRSNCPSSKDSSDDDSSNDSSRSRMAMTTGPRRSVHRARSACILGNSVVMTSWYNNSFEEESGTRVCIKCPAHGVAEGFSFGSDHSEITRVYGESLTPIDSTRAIRFGGFSSPGYGDALADIAILEVREGRDYSFYTTSPRFNVSWDFPTIQMQSSGPLSVPPPGLARGFHASALVMGRYLVVMGGLHSSAQLSGLSQQAMILDTQTWTWLDNTTLAVPNCKDGSFPTNRHSFSLIWDELRKRLLVFGGSNETEHAGGDLADVWQLVPPKPIDPDNVLATFPWEWSRVHENVWGGSQPVGTGNSNLSPKEALCLGRSHAAHMVTKDTVVFLFGSSKPSSNGLIMYNLRTDTFVRPRVQGSLPSPRLLCSSVYVPKFQSIYITGGWSTQEDGPVKKSMESLVLQLVPGVSTKNTPVATNGEGWYHGFDVKAPSKPSEKQRTSYTYLCGPGTWHGYAIQEAAMVGTGTEAPLDIHRARGTPRRHMRIVEFANESDEEDDEEEEEEEGEEDESEDDDESD